ncbi:uncharacterized protein LOC132407666 isoform X5 [Hypanus sabinus]|uniref:uncharacterized protein LOC132407666 isoform X5 n=1 Tax=Hypanus sabinus TaxID=79690 RepID=UPI0028C4048B|nr:uncharacterized protein LOC132407666 isoform X5 [Hypanus sabinus]
MGRRACFCDPMTSVSRTEANLFVHNLTSRETNGTAGSLGVHGSKVPAPLSHSMPPLSNATHSQHPRMEPGVLIFLLYVMIIHELVCGWIEYKRQAAKPKKPARPVWCPHLLSFARSLVLSFVWLLFCLEFIENACKEMTLRYSSRTHSGSKEFFLRMYVKCGSPVHSRPPIHSTKQEKLRDWKKSGRIVRKA